MQKPFLIMIVAIFASMSSHAETVEQATKHYFQVMRSGDSASVAELFDPAELRSFRESLGFLTALPETSKGQVYGALFGAGSTQESVNSLSDREYFASFFEYAMAQGGIGQMMRTAKTEYLGHVMEGDDMAHAVTRISVAVPGTDFETISVASFVRRGDQWKMKLTGDIRSVAQKIRAAVGM